MADTCALCLHPWELVNSHVIPEFMYEGLYDDKHRFHTYSLAPEVRRKFEQKGLREKLLCKSCEDQISKYERYTSLLFRGDIEVENKTIGNLIIVSPVDYPMLRLFMLSILWRSAISKLDFFTHVALGPHEERLRMMLKNEETSPPWLYGCLIAAPLLEDEIQQGVMVQPTQARSQEGIKVFRFLFAGLAWVFFVSSHKHRNGIETASPERTRCSSNSEDRYARSTATR